MGRHSPCVFVSECSLLAPGMVLDMRNIYGTNVAPLLTVVDGPDTVLCTLSHSCTFLELKCDGEEMR